MSRPMSRSGSRSGRRALLSSRDPTGVLSRSALQIARRTMGSHTPRHLSRQEADRLLKRAMRVEGEEVLEDTFKQGARATGHRVVVRNVVVPAKRQVKVPVKTMDIQPIKQKTRVKVKRLVKVPGWKEIDEEYTVVKQRPVKVQKEVWVKKLVEVEEMQPYTVKRTRKKKVPVEKLKEVEEWQEVDVTTDQAVTVNGYRVDEVEDRKVVQVKEEQKYELVPRLLTERRILSARSLGVEEHQPHMSRHLGNRAYSPRSVAGVPDDEFPDDVERLPPMAKHIHSRIGTVVAQREHHPQPVVKHVRRGYPAHDAGLQVGDEVLGVDDEPVKDLRSLHDAVYSHSDVQTWHIARHGQRHAVTIQKRPGTGALTGRSRR